MYQNRITAVKHGRYLYADKLKTISHTIELFKEKMNYNKIKHNFVSKIFRFFKKYYCNY